jgi:acyl-CoA synthetase (NDP forming)
LRAAIRFPTSWTSSSTSRRSVTLVIASAGAGNQVEHVINLRNRTDKVVAFFWTASRADQGTLARLKSANVPIFYSPEKLAGGLKSLIDYHAWRDRKLNGSPATVPLQTEAQTRALGQARNSGHATLSESESKQLLAAWGIAGALESAVNSADAAAEAAQKIGYPVVLKVDSPDILHKTEAGVVRLRLRDAAEVRKAYTEIMTSAAHACARCHYQRRSRAGNDHRWHRSHCRSFIRCAAWTDAALRYRRRDG